MGSQKDRVKLNVGGRIFETTAATLAVAGRNSLFGAMFDDNWNLKSDITNTERFTDRNPDCFAVLLDLLRTGELCILPNIHERLLYREAMYSGILDHVRSAKWGTLDGNRLQLARSITGRSTWKNNVTSPIWVSNNGTGTIRASLSSGCCVVNPLIHGGSIVKLYDWMLEEHPIINLDYLDVNDVCWIDSENIVVSSCKNLGSGGMGLFSASTGNLKYKFQVKDDELKNWIDGALGVSSDYKLFFSCRIGSKHGIGVWDQVTGKQTSFFHEQPGKLLGNASRLQLFHGTNCLMVASLRPSYISLLDLRANIMGWSWSRDGEGDFRDVLLIEESNSICVVDYKDELLGYIDLRSNGRSVEWKRRYPVAKVDKSCDTKLAFHQGQLLSSMDHGILVYSGSNWTLTSKLNQSHGGTICDISIGGDRLFALHKEQVVIDVWETPRSPII